VDADPTGRRDAPRAPGCELGLIANMSDLLRLKDGAQSGQRRGVSRGGTVTKAEIKVYPDSVVYGHADDGAEYEPIA
jgi:hypothetical protein